MKKGTQRDDEGYIVSEGRFLLAVHSLQCLRVEFTDDDTWASREKMKIGGIHWLKWSWRHINGDDVISHDNNLDDWLYFDDDDDYDENFKIHFTKTSELHHKFMTCSDIIFPQLPNKGKVE